MEHIVDYKKYCKECVYGGTDEAEDPCDECLRTPVNEDSHKPIMYKEKRSKATTDIKERA